MEDLKRFLIERDRYRVCVIIAAVVGGIMIAAAIAYCVYNFCRKHGLCCCECETAPPEEDAVVADAESCCPQASEKDFVNDSSVNPVPTVNPVPAP
jgi:hypothetical protein